MFKKIKNKKTYIAVTGIVLMTTVFATTGEAGYVDPGSEGDPIVSKTYVDKKINEIKDNLSSRLDKTEKDIIAIKGNNGSNNTNESVQAVSEKFKVLELKKGEIIIAEESSEIIVRSGSVNAIGSNQGGISDITEGIDLQTAQAIKPNHLLIIPRSDGRGIEVKGDGAFVMIKGKYTIN